MGELTYEPVEGGDQPQVSEAGAADAAGETSGQRTGIMRPGNRGAGRIVAPWTPEQARIAARRRWELASAAARAGIMDAGRNVPDLDARRPADVIRYAVGQHMLNSFDPSAHGSQQSLKLALDLAYPKPERDPGGSVTVTEGGTSVTAQLSADEVRALLTAMRERRQGGE